MKILWLSAINLTIAREKHDKSPLVTGGWINSMITELKKIRTVSSINIVSVHKGKRIERITDGKVIYTLVPSQHGVFKYDFKLYKYLNEVISEFQPDIIDVQGIEFFLVKSLLVKKIDIPIVATIQGLTFEYYRHYNAGIDTHKVFKYLTLRNFLKFDGLFSGKLQYKKRAKNEISTLKKIKYVLGRTDWDKAYSLLHNDQLNYFHCDRILRDDFYRHHWNNNTIERFSIFTTQARYPIKGLHFLLKSIQILKKSYPSIKLYIGGKDLSEKKGLMNYLKYSDYQKYIESLIRKYELKEQIVFTGFLDGRGVARRLCKTHVFVIPSVIENSPNALGEAQMVGTPSVASLVGGIGNYVTDGETGLLFNWHEPVMLAAKIKMIFDDDHLAETLCLNAKKAAVLRHGKKKNSIALLSAYEKIIEMGCL